MATWAIAGRSTSTLIRTTWRTTTTTSAKSSSTRIPPSASPIRPNLTLRQSPISPPSCERFVRRQLSSLLPLHGAIASAKLVSKLPSEVSISSEGRFANYVSPI
ncbi:uncharacterized protein [Euphorbia lathyris]|uniref:uncharacterized protein isoform X1 n=1 Tax=Euphorbia lathyris TaxID=212925 RepID=UPI003313172D